MSETGFSVKSLTLAMLETDLIEVTHTSGTMPMTESHEAVCSGVDGMWFPSRKTAVVNEFKSFLKLVTEAFKKNEPPYLLQHGGTSNHYARMRAASHKVIYHTIPLYEMPE